MKKSAILWLIAIRIVIAKAQEASGNDWALAAND